MGSGYSQAKALSIIPHVTGTMSVLGSGSILHDVLSDGGEKLKRPYHRILLGLSTADALSSLALALSTLPIPARTAGVYRAIGTTSTCTAQGFFVQLYVLSCFYSVILSAYYLLLGKYRLSDEEIATYEKWMHAAAIALGLGFALLGLPLTLYNSANLWCWVAAYPHDCENAAGSPGPRPCERGQNAWLFRWLIFYIPIWLSVGAVVAMMSIITQSVYAEEKEMVRLQNELRHHGDQQEAGSGSGGGTSTNAPLAVYKNRYERSKLVSRQAAFYVAGFLVSILFASVNRLYQLITGRNSFALLLGHSIFAPLQGFFNMIIYRHGKVTA